MPQIRLYPQNDSGLPLPNASGPGSDVPLFRLWLWVRIGGEAARRKAVLDTGAPLCIFSKQVWAPLHARGAIEWLGHPPGAEARPPSCVTLHGRTYPSRTGRVLIQLVDLEAGALPPAMTLVHCTEDERQTPSDPETLPRLLVLGMAGLLNGRTRTLQVSPEGGAWQASLSE